MRYNLFGDPLPATAAEMTLVMDVRDLDPGAAHAAVYETEDADPEGIAGWYAEVADAGSGEGFFVTLNFATREALVAALRSAGISDIEVME